MIPTLALALAAQTAPAQDEPIPVLLVSGANNHDWEWTSAELERTLEGSGRFDVTVTREPARELARHDLARYHAFVLDYNGPRWGEPAESRFLEAVRAGVGVVVLHAANNAFPGWTEYEELVAHLWREGAGHGSFHAFDVEILDREHPVTRALPDLRAHPDELYHRLAHMHEAPFRLLASALSRAETGGTGEREPMVVVRHHGAGRVFHTPLGHVWPGVPATRISHQDPQFQNLVLRGTEWAATGAVTDGSPLPNRLTSLERIAGWRLLFDGRSLDGWRRYGGDAPPEGGWEVRGGALRVLHEGGGGDLVTREAFEDFELELEWKVARGANSGIKLRVLEQSGAGALGPEYQLLDDPAHPEIASEHSAGALYDILEPGPKQLALTGAFNHTRILARGPRIEHWLDGERLLALDLASPAAAELLAASKFAGIEGFGRSAGPILLQDHGGEAWFQSLRLRDLAKLPGREILLHDGATLAGWRELGDARWTSDAGGILGEVGGGGQSFLVTEARYGDFLLELDVKNEAPGNAGIQIRSHVRDDGVLAGYQIEIDPSERSWSGGLYEEMGRGWLNDLSDAPAARAAFRRGEWNHYRIECVGPSIRAWIDNVPTADHLDAAALEGILGLQVHSGRDTRVRWRDLRLFDLGHHEWRPLPVRNRGSLVEHFEDGSLRLRYRSSPSPAIPHVLVLRAQEGSNASAELSEELALWRAPRSPFAADDAGWTVPLPFGSHTLTVMHYGDRLAVDLDGERFGELRGDRGPSTGSVVLRPVREPHGTRPDFELEALESLVHVGVR